jgi:hypothetical protein
MKVMMILTVAALHADGCRLDQMSARTRLAGPFLRLRVNDGVPRCEVKSHSEVRDVRRVPCGGSCHVVAAQMGKYSRGKVESDDRTTFYFRLALHFISVMFCSVPVLCSIH